MKRRQRGDTAGLYIAGVLILLLLLSLAGNAWFWHERDSLMQREATVTQLQADTKASAKACSDSVDSLAEQGRIRGAALAKALAAVAPKVAELQKEQFDVLKRKPDNPGDLCGSLQRFLQSEIKKERSQ